eukprot:752390-Hanusia_phi.AAC.3
MGYTSFTIGILAVVHYCRRGGGWGYSTSGDRVLTGRSKGRGGTALRGEAPFHDTKSRSRYLALPLERQSKIGVVKKQVSSTSNNSNGFCQFDGGGEGNGGSTSEIVNGAVSTEGDGVVQETRMIIFLLPAVGSEGM